MHGLGQRGRDVLADVVRADRQLPVAAVDEDGELDRTGPADVGQRVEGGRGSCGRRTARRRRAPRSDRRSPPAGMSVSSRARTPRSRRSSRYIVTSSAPTGTSTFSMVGDPGRDPAWRASRRGSGCRAGRCWSAPWLRSTISWAIRVSARCTSSASRTGRAIDGSPVIGRRPVCAQGAAATRRHLLVRLTGRD